MKQKIKFILKDLLLGMLYIAVIHFVAVNEVIGGLIISIIFDIVIVGFFIELKKDQQKTVLNNLCEKNGLIFNEDFYEQYNSVFEKRIKLFVYSLVGVVPFSNYLFDKLYNGQFDSITANSEVLKRIDPLLEHIIIEIVIVSLLTILWAAFLSVQKDNQKCSKLYNERKKRTGSPYDSLDEEFSVFIGEYSDAEIIILNGALIPTITNSQSTNSNP